MPDQESDNDSAWDSMSDRYWRWLKARNIFLNTTLPSDYFLSNVHLGLKYVYSNLLQWTWLTFPMPDSAWIYLLDLLRHGVALDKFLEKFVLAVKICHQETLPSATPSFPVGKKLCKTKKHQRCRSAWVGQADFGKLELNNRNHSGNCQCLSVKRDQSETRSVWNKRGNFQTFALLLWTDEVITILRHFKAFMKTLWGRALHKPITLRSFKVISSGTLFRWAKCRIRRQAFQKLIIIRRAKCSLRRQALHLPRPRLLKL